MKNNSTLPKDFEDRIRQQLGSAFVEFERSLEQPPPVSIRINTSKNFELNGERVPWCTAGRYLPERPVFTLDPSFHAGAYYVQEASSMFLEQAIHHSVEKNTPLKVLDLCASPGGKSTHLLNLLPENSLLISNEVIRSRASILSENIQKWGNANVIITNNDPEAVGKLEGFFDVMVVDAPCSGEGLFRKDADAMNEWSTANVDLCSKRQRRILSDVWPALKTNGILIYSTCTYSEAENEENLHWLQNNHTIESISIPCNPSWGVTPVAVGTLQGYRFYPHRVKGEGFFIAVVRKMEDQPTARSKQRNKLTMPPKKITSQLQPWLTNEGLNFFQWNDLAISFPTAYWSDLEYVMQHLKIVQAGTACASIKHEKLIPEHSLALSNHLNKSAFPCAAVDVTTALHYLRKDPIEITAKKGFTIIQYNNLPLGWINVLDNRSNNLYPKEWRIRMS